MTKLIVALFLISCTCSGQLPDAPSVVRQSFVSTQSSSVRLPRPTRPCRGLSDEGTNYGVYNHQTGIYERAVRLPLCSVWTGRFISAHGAFLAAIVYDVEVTHQGSAHHKCPEGNLGLDLGLYPGRSQMYRNNLLEQFLPITAWDYLMAKMKPPKSFSWLPYVGATAGVGVHVRGGTEWLTGGCW
jgi:hypothetical protein